jgi:hypothetical protein
VDRIAADGRLPIPTLDDRRFQDLVDQAMRLRDQRCPEWNSTEPGDPGVVLIEILAFMIDQLLYRVNQVPDRMYSTFLDMVGVRTRPGAVAETRVDFFAAARPTETIRIPRGTRIATPATDDAEPVEFSTVEDALIQPVELRWTAQVVDGQATPAPAQETSSALLGEAENEDLVLGYTNALPGSLIMVDLSIDDNVVADLRWRMSTPNGWTWAQAEQQTNGHARFIIDTGADWAATRLGEVTAHWIRVGLPVPLAIPVVVVVNDTVCVGVAARAHHASVIQGERAGVSDGRPAQRFRTHQAPVLLERHKILVAGTEWQAVDSLVNSAPEDRHVELDTVSGEIQFGDGVHGAIPAEGAAVVVDYLTGGGSAGNVAARRLTVLRDAVPFVSAVQNRLPAWGGRDPEPVEEARRRAPAVLRSGWRAVSPADFEQLALQATPLLARARCVADGEGPPRARLLLVPQVGPDEESFSALGPTSAVFDDVRAFLSVRRVVGVSVFLDSPRYRGVRVVASVTGTRNAQVDQVGERAAAALRAYLHPVTGGRDRRGWPFGRRLVAGELFGVLLDVPGVDVVDELRIFPADPVTGDADGATDRIELSPDGLFWPMPAVVRVTLP